jgi:HAD superfamily hydrolase (TIGR01509 family)
LLRALIFDFDGVILDTESPIYALVGEEYAAHGAVLTPEIWTKVVGGTVEGFDLYDHLAELIGRDVDRDAIRDRVRVLDAAIVPTLPILAGVETHIREARERGLLLGVASSSPREFVVSSLEHIGLLANFDSVKTQSDVGVRKPRPDVYFAVLEALGVSGGEAIAIEDSPNGVTAARAAGVFCVAVPNAVTRFMPLGHADMRVESLGATPLSEVVAAYERSRG